MSKGVAPLHIFPPCLTLPTIVMHKGPMNYYSPQKSQFLLVSKVEFKEGFVTNITITLS
jgi:hypothetical protein